jgi:hypothetical protein
VAEAKELPINEGALEYLSLLKVLEGADRTRKKRLA